jgi:formate hydrogenlyase subunit 3/multisubunit Na+/H+ antiporter MnhD subunit
MIELLLFCVLGLLGLAVLGCVTARMRIGRPLIYGGSLALTVVILVIALMSVGASPERITLPLGLPWIGMHARLDPLSAAFLVLVGLGGAGASLYAIGYGRHEHEPQRVLPFYPAFLAGMTLVVLADDAFLFLFAWELMSLSSWALVLAQPDQPGNAQAGFVYLVMAVFSGLTLLLAFGMLAGPMGAYTFAAMRAARPSGGLAALVFVLALVGAGSKAGLVPLHVWLPLAHPAAPSHVSALMSGVMTKVAIYGFIRIVFDLLGGPTWWGAVLVLGLGGITAVLGVLHAMMERDLKRLLAYSTVENIGIIFIGLGLALAFQTNGFTSGAALALTAALFHALNHTVFKSLLFFGAGAVLNATGERDMERLGGLIHRMPRTAFAVLVGCVAISALPPLNGFVSEWMTFQAILLRPEMPQWGLKLMIPVVGALLALAAALAAACFVRAFGITFLGRPRSPVAERAREVDLWSVTAMLLFAAFCLLGGILPGLVIDFLAPVTQSLLLAHMPVQLAETWLTIVPIAASRSSYNGLLVFVFIAASTIMMVLAIHRFASHAKRRGPAWDCGFPDPRPATQYTAASFAQPIRRVFGAVVFRTSEVVDMPAPGELRAAGIRKLSHDLIWEGLYAPIARLVLAVADGMNVLQFLTIRRYLGFVFFALVLLLLTLTLWQ